LKFAIGFGLKFKTHTQEFEYYCAAIFLIEPLSVFLTFGRLNALSFQACLQNKMPVSCGGFLRWRQMSSGPDGYRDERALAMAYALSRSSSHWLDAVIAGAVLVIIAPSIIQGF